MNSLKIPFKRFSYFFIIMGSFVFQSCGDSCVDNDTFRNYEKIEEIIDDRTVTRYKQDGEFFTGNVCLDGLVIKTFKDGYMTDRYDHEDDRVDHHEVFIKGIEVSDTTWRFTENGERYIRSYSHFSPETGKRDGLFLEMWGPNQIERKSTYKDGNIIGIDESYREDGSPVYKREIGENGLQHGISKEWGTSDEEGYFLKDVFIFEKGIIKEEWGWVSSYVGKSMWVKQKENFKSTHIGLDNDGNLKKVGHYVPLTPGLYVFPDYTKKDLKDFNPEI